MVNDEHTSNNFDNENHGVQALWATFNAQEKLFNGIKRKMWETQQTIVGLGLPTIGITITIGIASTIWVVANR